MRKPLIIAAVIVLICGIAAVAAMRIERSGGTPASSADASSEGAATALLASSTPASASTSDAAARSTLHLLRVGNAEYRVGIADTEATREQGLSGRTSLAPDEGLFFVWSSPQSPDQGGIWMKDMNFAIDVIWFDANMRVVTIVPDMTPESYPIVYVSTGPAQYVLEVPAGSVAKSGIIVGDQASLSDVSK